MIMIEDNSVKNGNIFKISMFIGVSLFLGFSYFTMNFRSFIPFYISFAYICFYNYNSENEFRSIFRISLIVLFISALSAFYIYTFKRFSPELWDFTCFYLYGKMAMEGLNFYNPVEFQHILKIIELPISINDIFIREVIDVGCPYPPPTLLLFSTLGLFSFENAYIFWFILNHLFLIGSIILLKKIFFDSNKFSGFMISTILVVTFNASLLTISYSQILFILLFVLLMLFRYKEKPVSGLFLALAVFLKPFAGILLIYFIVRRRMQPVLVFILSFVFICLITTIFFGFLPFVEYLTNNPVLREPNWLFNESINQSLLAELLRFFTKNKIIAHGLYYLLSFVLLSFTGILIYMKRKEYENYDIFFPLLLSISLLIYPSGMAYYSVVQIISVLILLRYITDIEISALLIFIFYLLSFGGLFYINIFILILSILIFYKKNFFQFCLYIRTSTKSVS
jgi:hypothetical protein